MYEIFWRKTHVVQANTSNNNNNQKLHTANTHNRVSTAPSLNDIRCWVPCVSMHSFNIHTILNVCILNTLNWQHRMKNRHTNQQQNTHTNQQSFDKNVHTVFSLPEMTTIGKMIGKKAYQFHCYQHSGVNSCHRKPNRSIRRSLDIAQQQQQ